uniref:Uncharacterized protein n=1 Tax=Anopheles christyi TaxID=43041 RepID=A0A182KIM5_9DIPT
DEPVRAEVLRHAAIVALVVLVALVRVRELSVRFRAGKLKVVVRFVRSREQNSQQTSTTASRIGRLRWVRLLMVCVVKEATSMRILSKVMLFLFAPSDRSRRPILAVQLVATLPQYPGSPDPDPNVSSASR